MLGAVILRRKEEKMDKSYKKVTKKPLDIHYLPDQDSKYDMQPSFTFNGQRYWLKDFIRAHNNVWINDSTFPSYIDAYQANEYHFPLYLQIHDNETLDVWIYA